MIINQGEDNIMHNNRMHDVATQEIIKADSGTQMFWLRGLALILVALAIFFRFSNLDRKIFWHDEIYTSLHVSGGSIGATNLNLFSGREIGAGEIQAQLHILPGTNVMNTIRSTALYDAQHSPIFYAATRLWAERFGDSAAGVRAFTALVSLIAFPCLYWLCMELFASSRVAWTAIALMAVSPFHLLYAQEARDYSLWTVAILLSSAAFLRALRRQTPLDLALYAATLIFGLWSHAMIILTAVAHGVYVVGTFWSRTEPASFSRRQIIRGYLVASVVSIVAFLPWMWVMFVKRSTIAAYTGWMSEPVPLATSIKSFGLGLCSVFMDWNHYSLSLQDGSNQSLFVAAIFVLILVVYSLVFLCRSTSSRTWLLPLALIATTVCSAVVPDLLFGGRRSGVARFQTPSYLAVELAVAYLLVTRMTLKAPLQRRFWQAAMSVLILAGLASCAMVGQAQSWWNKGGNGVAILQAADSINRAPRPLVIAEPSGANFGHILALGRLLDPAVRLRVAPHPKLPVRSSNFSDIFLFAPSPYLLQQLGLDASEVVQINPELSRVRHIELPASGNAPRSNQRPAATTAAP
jgi:uncharacterized membrane protein